MLRAITLAAAITFGVAAPCYAQSGLSRATLQSTDLPGTDYKALLTLTTIAPNAKAPRHTHPGIESSYIESGDGELMIAGEPNRHVASGDHFQIPPGVPHSIDAGGSGMKIVTTYVVQKDKPLATPAPQ